MDGENNGAEEAQDERQQETQAQQQWELVPEAIAGSDVDVSAYEAQIAERDSRIAELEGQIAEAAKNAEAAEELRGEIAALKEQGESERIDFQLQLAGCRNVKAARAVLSDHGGDIDALKEAEPWMFQEPAAKQTGKTGLPNAGTATDEGKTLKRWEELAGLDGDE